MKITVLLYEEKKKQSMRVIIRIKADQGMQQLTD